MMGQRPPSRVMPPSQNLTKSNAAARFMTFSSKDDISRLSENRADAQARGCSEIPSSNKFQCATTTPDQSVVEVPYDWKINGYACLSATASIKLASAAKPIVTYGAHLRRVTKAKPSPQLDGCSLNPYPLLL